MPPEKQWSHGRRKTMGITIIGDMFSMERSLHRTFERVMPSPSAQFWLGYWNCPFTNRADLW